MRQAIREFMAIVADSLPISDPIYEFGSLILPGQEDVANLRQLFPGRTYVGVDMREGPGVDKVANLHEITLPDESVGTALCLETLEHVEYPHRALEEIFRIVAPGGVAVLSVPMDFPIHEFPHDYWRFTPEGIRSLLKPFPNAFVGYYGDERFPNGVVGIGFKGPVPPLGDFTRRYGEWQAHYTPVDRETALKRTVKLLTPPLLHSLLASVYRAAKRCGT
jgi:SAM-dependent methyltransferase